MAGVEQIVDLALEALGVVEHIHQGVLVGLPDSHIAISVVQAGGTGTLGLRTSICRLTAAHDTAAGASRRSTQ